MSTISIAQTGIRVWVSRDYSTYTYRRWENGVEVATEPISQARAEQIVRANPGGNRIGMDGVNFEPGGKQFTYQIMVYEASDVHD